MKRDKIIKEKTIKQISTYLQGGNGNMDLNTVTGSKMRGKISKKRLIIFAAVILLIVAAGVYTVKSMNSAKTSANTSTKATASVEKGDLSVVISGSAPISSSTKFNFTSNVNGTLTNIYFKDGDKVKAGDLIFEIDDKDAQLKLKQLQNSIAQSKLSYDNNIADLKASTVTAPIDGEIMEIQVKEGDTLSNNGTLLTITDKSKLKLLVSFNNTYRSKLAAGQEVSVNAYDTTRDELYKVTGTISGISTPSYTTADGSEVYNVSVTINNTSSLTEDMVANVTLNIDGKEVKSTDSNNLSYFKTMTVKAESGGRLEKLNVENGQNVKKGDILAELNNDDLRLTVETGSLKLQDLALQLQTAEEQLQEYKIYAPFDGTVTFEDIEQGNSIKQGDVLGSVANYDAMEFVIDVDELDISKIEVGQTAKVTIDALSETTRKPLKGTVTEIAVEGASSGGVSTYPVTIQLEYNENLKGSMNANAEILVSQKTGVLYVPVDAVQKRNGKSFVAVVKASEVDKTGSNTKVKGSDQQTERREVKTGISTEEYIEIVSGLSEGEKVVVTSTSNTNNQRMPNMGIPGMGGPQGGNNARRN